jgi:hypothetical protein
MAVSGLSAASTYAASQQVQSLTPPQKRTRPPSVSEVDMQSPSSALAPSPTSKTGRTVDIIA